MSESAMLQSDHLMTEQEIDNSYRKIAIHLKVCILCIADIYAALRINSVVRSKCILTICRLYNKPSGRRNLKKHKVNSCQSEIYVI